MRRDAPAVRSVRCKSLGSPDLVEPGSLGRQLDEVLAHFRLRVDQKNGILVCDRVGSVGSGPNPKAGTIFYSKIVRLYRVLFARMMEIPTGPEYYRLTLRFFIGNNSQIKGAKGIIRRFQFGRRTNGTKIFRDLAADPAGPIPEPFRRIDTLYSSSPLGQGVRQYRAHIPRRQHAPARLFLVRGQPVGTQARHRGFPGRTRSWPFRGYLSPWKNRLGGSQPVFFWLFSCSSLSFLFCNTCTGLPTSPAT